MTNPLECRKSVRIKVRCYLTHIKADLNGDKLSGLSVDLSSGGLLFTSSVRYSLGDTVNVEIILPGWREFKPKDNNASIAGKEDTIAVTIRVLRVQEVDKEMYLVGASFIWADNESQKALEKYTHKENKGSKGFFG